MPKKIQTELKCDRCGAVWYEAYVPGGPEPDTASLEVTLKTPLEGSDGVSAERTVVYEVLCHKCVNAVTGYVDNIDIDPDARRKPRGTRKGPKAPAAPTLPSPSDASGTGVS